VITASQVNKGLATFSHCWIDQLW